MSRRGAFATPPPPHGASELHAYIALLEDEVLRLGGVLPAHRPDVLGPFRERAQQQAKSVWKSFIAGGVAAMVGGSAVHPIDVIKVRQQLFGMKDGFGVGSSWVAESSHDLVHVDGLRHRQGGGCDRPVQRCHSRAAQAATFVGTKFVLAEQFKQYARDQNGDLVFVACRLWTRSRYRGCSRGQPVRFGDGAHAGRR